MRCTLTASTALTACAIAPLALALGCGNAGAHSTRTSAGDGTPISPQSGHHIAVVAQGVAFKWHSKPPGGKLRMVADVKADSGAIDAVTGNSQLRVVKVLLYKYGAPAARMSAPVVQAAGVQRVLRASGGVTLAGMQQNGLVVTAQNVNWYSQANRIEAVGNVRFFSPGEYTKGVPVKAGPYAHVTFDTSLESFSVP